MRRCASISARAPARRWPAAGATAIIGRVRVCIVGFGLIGGSIARALRARGESEEWHVTAWSRTHATVEQAVADGVVDEAKPALEDAIEGSELVVLAAPPLTCLDLVDQIGGPLRGALAEDGDRHRRGQRQGQHRRPSGRRRPAFRGRPPDGRA